MPVFWWMRLDLVSLVGKSMSGGVFWGVCGLMILGSLCANGWGCVPVLLVVWHRVSCTVACWLLSGAGSWHWDGGLWEIFTIWYCVELGGLLWTSVLNLALLPQWHNPDAWLEHQEPVLHTVLKIIKSKSHCKSKIERQADLASGESPLPGSQPAMICCVLTWWKGQGSFLGQSFF